MIQRDFNLGGRSAAMAANGMAATSHPLATLTALDVLRAGGNAVDAAIAAVAVQCVVEPQSTGIGGDCFVLYSKKGELPIALSGAGRAPSKADAEWYADRQIREIAIQTPHAVTVPGAIDAWCLLNREHGTKPLSELLEPAAKAAEEGYVVTPRIAWDWARNEAKLQKDPFCARLMLKAGRAPEAGDLWLNPALAHTLRRIGREGRSAFYEGAVARDLVNRLKELGGLHELEDFAEQRSQWVEPIHASYRGWEVYECPPANQGLTALMILKILEGYDISQENFSEADRLHLIAEATKAAFHIRDTKIGDPDFTNIDVETYLSSEWAEGARSEIRLDRALPPQHWETVEHKDTVYLCVVDRDGNAVSFINSLFSSFGSGIVGPESGVILHNRGSGFRTVPGHPNAIAPRKRPFHTLIPGMLVKNGRAVMPFGVMGGQYQAVGHATFLHRLLDRDMNPQQAAEAPRVFAYQGVLQVERSNGESIFADLARRGHRAEWAMLPLGGCQAIWIDWDRGVFIGGSEPRKDGLALGY